MFVCLFVCLFLFCLLLFQIYNRSFLFVVHLDSDEDLSPGELSPRAPVHLTAKKGRAGGRVPNEKQANGFARAYDLGEKCYV